MVTPTNSLERALIILDLVGRRKGGLSNAELSRELGIATSSCSYIVSRLEREGYLKRHRETGRYEIGMKVLSIANSALRNLALRQLAEPTLQKVAGDTGLSGCIGLLDRGRVMLVEKVTLWPLSLHVGPGSHLPLHATSLGKVLSAYLQDAERSDLIRRHTFTRHAARTVVSRSEFLDELDAVRVRGYGTSNDEHLPQWRAVAAPIVGPSGEIAAAISAAGPGAEPVWYRTDEVTALVQAAARAISRRVAHFR